MDEKRIPLEDGCEEQQDHLKFISITTEYIKEKWDLAGPVDAYLKNNKDTTSSGWLQGNLLVCHEDWLYYVAPGGMSSYHLTDPYFKTFFKFFFLMIF